ncbi:SUMF1/EgtB/PvdO family nonheme iron enzyme [bacterium]|nr:SUMF1/EgtB/PvdO family nonheme iron enzyme [bacterium]
MKKTTVFLLLLSFIIWGEESIEKIDDKSKIENSSKEINQVKPIEISGKKIVADSYEITVEEFSKCVDSKNCKSENFLEYSKSKNRFCNYGNSEKKNHPMNCVNYYGAEEYCKSVGKRLPTTDEWIFLAKGGENNRYIGGNNIDELSWYKDNSDKSGTKPVGLKKKNGYNLYDMGGNVIEWTDSWLGTNQQYKILHGGGWSSSKSDINSSGKTISNPKNSLDSYGFRCVKDI